LNELACLNKKQEGKERKLHKKLHTDNTKHMSTDEVSKYAATQVCPRRWIEHLDRSCGVDLRKGVTVHGSAAVEQRMMRIGSIDDRIRR
jgi:hypothetical protein